MHCVDLGESFPTSIYLQNLASIQPRTSPFTFPRSPRTDPPGSSPMNAQKLKERRRRRPVQAATATPILMKCDAIYAMCFWMCDNIWQYLVHVWIFHFVIIVISMNIVVVDALFGSLRSTYGESCSRFSFKDRVCIYSEMILDFQHEGRPIAIFVRRVPLLKTVQSHCIWSAQ